MFTDGWVGYDKLGKYKNFTHKTVNHINEYVNGRVHTQGIENFWSLLKRGLTGTYVAVEPFHMDSYVGEQVFRYNNRKNSDSVRFQCKRPVFAVCTRLSSVVMMWGWWMLS